MSEITENVPASSISDEKYTTFNDANVLMRVYLCIKIAIKNTFVIKLSLSKLSTCTHILFI